jgi:glycosyltransferase involved in cell wall biosynthesis
MKFDSKLTLIIGTFNNDYAKIKDSIDGIIIQSFKSFKLIVVDDNHKKDQNISNNIKKYILGLGDSRIKYIKNTTNIGVPFVYRKWLDLVESEYFMILAEGDCLLEDALQKMVSFLDYNENADFVHGLEIKENGDLSKPLFESSGLISTKVYLDSKFLGGPFGWSQASAMYRTEIFKVKNIKIVHDWYWDFYFHCTLLVYSEKIGYINEYLAKRGNDGISYEEAKRINYFRINTERIYLGLKFLDEFEFYLINKGYPVNYYRNQLCKRLVKDSIILKDSEKSNFALRLAIVNYSKLLILLIFRALLYFPRIFYKNRL